MLTLALKACKLVNPLKGMYHFSPSPQRKIYFDNYSLFNEIIENLLFGEKTLLKAYYSY